MYMRIYCNNKNLEISLHMTRGVTLCQKVVVTNILPCYPLLPFTFPLLPSPPLHSLPSPLDGGIAPGQFFAFQMPMREFLSTFQTKIQHFNMAVQTQIGIHYYTYTNIKILKRKKLIQSSVVLFLVKHNCPFNNYVVYSSVII